MVHKHVLVIGAGQCGLAAGRYLQNKGIDFLILEKNKHIGDNWRKRYESLTLFTPASLSALPELPMAIDPKSRPGKNQMADYFNRYVEHFDLPVHVNEEVLEIRKESGNFLVKTSFGEYTAQKIIYAAGFCDKPYLPEWAAGLTIPYIHSSEYKTPVSVKGKKVLLVGTGNSAAQIGAELTKYFGVHWSTNKKPKFSALHMFGRNILTLAKKLGRLDKAVSEKTILNGEAIYLFGDLKKQLKKAQRKKKVVKAEGSVISFDGGETKSYDFVLFATGFKPNFDFIIIPEFENDLVQLRKQQGLSVVSGLYFLGIPYQRSRSSQLIYGAQRDAAYIVEQILQSKD
jgi:putative flavoprotein involved in K+ transport